MSEPISAAQNLAEFFSMQWVDVLSALLTPFIAILGSLIAYRQWRLAKLNLKEKLFERRYRIVDAAKEYTIQSRFGPEEDARIAHDGLIRVMGEAKYLFSEEVHITLLELQDAIRKKRLNEIVMNARGARMTEEDWNKVIDQTSILGGSIQKTFERIETITAPFMTLSDDK
ncbi:hypothetical protein [uncultured Roseobacter sp.]|uniref:hypothetical protein n=1 Tax=uncultured Roseobacter sp. TaxID=114847 RepID=UPI00263A0481|nr:hypothetical protein [uncultured Roseobacter sp.]